jgi:hypothetical protein
LENHETAIEVRVTFSAATKLPYAAVPYILSPGGYLAMGGYSRDNIRLSAREDGIDQSLNNRIGVQVDHAIGLNPARIGFISEETAFDELACLPDGFDLANFDSRVTKNPMRRPTPCGLVTRVSYCTS